MLSVILEFKPLNGKEQEFVAAWTECTQAIYENFGSLGSRLHSTNNSSFIAYAQWPDTVTYEKSSAWPDQLLPVRNKMRALLQDGKPTILHLLQVEVDLLKTTIYS